MSGPESPSDRLRFEEWMTEYKKHYDTEDEKELRFNAFQGNIRLIEAFNAKPNQTYKRGLNLFSDMTLEEFKEEYSGYNPKLDPDSDDDRIPYDNMPVSVKSQRSSDDVLPEPEPVKCQRRCCCYDVLAEPVHVKRQRRCCCDEKDTKEPENESEK